MPEANSAPNLSNPVSQHPRITPPDPGQKPKLLNRLREALRSRYFFVTQLLELGYDIRTVQELLGHVDDIQRIIAEISIPSYTAGNRFPAYGSI